LKQEESSAEGGQVNLEVGAGRNEISIIKQHLKETQLIELNLTGTSSKCSTRLVVLEAVGSSEFIERTSLISTRSLSLTERLGCEIFSRRFVFKHGEHAMTDFLLGL
jgi:hypothetical protein